MLNNQLELGLDPFLAAPGRNLRGPRSRHAQWWFDAMRQMVDRACDWEPPRPRPERADPATQDAPQICA
jgi:hypothetical protein